MARRDSGDGEAIKVHREGARRSGLQDIEYHWSTGRAASLLSQTPHFLLNILTRPALGNRQLTFDPGYRQNYFENEGEMERASTRITLPYRSRPLPERGKQIPNAKNLSLLLQLASPASERCAACHRYGALSRALVAAETTRQAVIGVELMSSEWKLRKGDRAAATSASDYLEIDGNTECDDVSYDKPSVYAALIINTFLSPTRIPSTLLSLSPPPSPTIPSRPSRRP